MNAQIKFSITFDATTIFPDRKCSISIPKQFFFPKQSHNFFDHPCRAEDMAQSSMRHLLKIYEQLTPLFLLPCFCHRYLGFCGQIMQIYGYQERLPTKGWQRCSDVSTSKTLK